MFQCSKPYDRKARLMIACGLLLVVAAPPLRDAGLLGRGALEDFACGLATGLGLTLEIGALIRMRRVKKDA
jgi:hypothetical protein